MKKIFSIAFLLLSFAAAAQRQTVYDGEFWQDQPLPGWEQETHDRIELMGKVTFTTQAPMAKCYHTKDAMFEAYEEVTGIPYSGVHDFCGYVGKDVSFHTFLSAVYNDRSSMYLVNYHLPPYNRGRAGPFYGTVCTASANYVWGFPLMLFTRSIRMGESVFLDDMGQNLDDLQLYDGVCYMQGSGGGHIVVISAIGRDKDGVIRHLETFEGTGPSNKIRSYPREEFQQRFFEKFDGHIYRYDHEKWGKLAKLAPFIEGGPTVERNFNKDLSPEDGERVTYPEGKIVKIDILSKKYKDIELRRDGKLFETRPVKGETVVSFVNLPTGHYTAVLTTPKKISAPVEFQVAQAECRAWYEDGQLYVGGCRDGVYPQGVYIASTNIKSYKSYSIAFLCIKVSDDSWKVFPNIPEGSVPDIKVNLAGTYGGYWAKIIKFAK